MGKKSSPFGHWTKGLSGNNATTKLGARFHMRKLFLRGEELSQDELEYVIQYLVNETTIQEQQWWVALAHFERLEIASRLTLHHVAKGEEQIIWFSRHETTKDCVLVYGTAEAKPIDPSAAAVLSFPEGSVVGNLNLPQSVLPQQNGGGGEPSSLEALASSGSTNWRRVKRERQFRGALHSYNKLVIFGPADYLLLTASDVTETISRAADRVERDKWVKAFGLERFAGCIRRKVFEPGAFLAKEDELLNSVFIVMDGECRAWVRGDDTAGSGVHAPNKKTVAEETLMHAHMFRSQLLGQLPIASLGSLSTVGDISVMLGVPEPATVQATTLVNVLWLSQEDFARECGDLRDPVIIATVEKLQKIALDTLGFVLERIEAESKHAQSDQRLKIESVREALRVKRELAPSVHPEASAHHQSSSSRTTSTIKTAAWSKYAPPTSLSAPLAVLPQVPRVLPSVVLQHAERIAQSSAEKRKNMVKSTASSNMTMSAATNAATTMNLFETEPPGLSDLLSPEPERDQDASPSRMTRQQKRAARAFTNLHSPIAAKSLGAEPFKIGGSTLKGDFEFAKAQDPSVPESREPSLFLFPTMTRQRQLHGNASIRISSLGHVESLKTQSPGNTNQQQLAVMASPMTPQLPETLSSTVTIKIGEPLTDCRVSGGPPVHVNFTVSDGDGVLRERLKLLFLNKPAIKWVEDSEVYIKTTVNAPQRDRKALPSDDQQFRAILFKTWQAASRKQQEPSICLFLYACGVQNTTSIHRATAARVTQATQDLANHLRDQGSDAVGPASLRYWATIHARQPDATPVQRPQTKTFRQLNFIDTQAAQHQQESQTSVGSSQWRLARA